MDEKLPTKWDIKFFAERKLGCSNFNDGHVRLVRSSFDYFRNKKRSIQTLSHYPGTRPSSNELVAHLKKGWYTKDTFDMVEKQWIPFPSPLDIPRLQNSQF